MKVTSVCATLFVVIGLNDRASAQVPEGYEVVVLANDLGSKHSVNPCSHPGRRVDSMAGAEHAPAEPVPYWRAR